MLKVNKMIDSPSRMPLISIITVVYNAKQQLENTILSVVNQDYPNIQYIVIDGNSTDGSLDVIKKYDNRISYWVSEPDGGVYDAMNKGLKIVKGDWVYFLGAGDILLNLVDKIVPQLMDGKYIYYGNVYRKDLMKVYDGRFSPFKLAVNNICHQCIFYPTDVFRDREYDVRYKIQADHKLNMDCFGDKRYAFKYLPIIVCLYEGDGYSAINPDLVFFRDKLKIIKTNFSLPVYWYAATRRALAKIFKSVYH